MLPLQTPEGQYLPEGSFYTIRYRGFYSCHPRDTLDSLALEPSSWVPWDRNSRRDSPWQPITPRALHRQQTEIPPVSLRKRCLLVQELWSGEKASSTLTGANRGALREWRFVDTVFPLTLCFATAHQYIPERTLYLYLRLSNNHYFEIPNRVTFLKLKTIM